MGYKIDGKKTDEIPAQASGYDKIECIYEKMPGWKTSTEGITEYGQTAEGSARVSGISREGKRARSVGMVSTGPDRDQTILVDEFAEELKTAAKQSLECFHG